MSGMSLKLIFLALLVLTGLLGNSCNDDGKDRETAATPQDGTAPDSTADTPADPPAQPSGGGTDAQVADTAVEEPGNSASASADDFLERHWQDTVINFKNPLSVTMELRSAEFNPAEAANMSILAFAASCRVGRKDWLHKDIVMDSLKSTDSATLELDICSVELMPLLKNPVISGRTSEGGSILTMEGGLRFIVRDPEGELMGTFLVNNDGELYDAEPGEHYSWRITRTDRDMLPAQYLFYRTPGVGDVIHYITAISYAHGSKATKQVKDPLGNIIKYNFPNGSVEIGPPEAPERERRNPEDDYRN